MQENITIGVDVGGANTKIASTDGDTATFYLPLWKGADLIPTLRRVKQDFRPDDAGVVITGEMADCFRDKRTGVLHIASAINEVFGRAHFFDISGQFSRNIEDPIRYAASNWVASVDFITKEVGDCVFVDVGSTTCDVIPIKNGRHNASLTDFERLQHNELIYMGVLRTNIAALLKWANIDGGQCRVSSESYATTADAHLILGNIAERDYICETSDGRPRNVDSSYSRIARVVVSDVNQLGKRRICEIAKQVEAAQIDELSNVLLAHSSRYHLQTVVAAGIGEFLVKKAARRAGLSMTSLSDMYGSERSKVFPAFAVAKLLERTL